MRVVKIDIREGIEGGHFDSAILSCAEKAYDTVRWNKSMS